AYWPLIWLSRCSVVGDPPHPVQNRVQSSLSPWTEFLNYSNELGKFEAAWPASLAKSALPRHERASGEMAEWLKAHAWKACVRETVPWVRIPLSPPAVFEAVYFLRERVGNLRRSSRLLREPDEHRSFLDGLSFRHDRI